MDKTVLLDYIDHSLHLPLGEKPGPVVTISREFGCPSKPVAERLVSALQESDHEKWRMFDREAVNMAAHELNIPVEMVENTIRKGNQGILRDFMISFSREYIPEDLTIKKKYAAIVLSVAAQGHAVILGRGGEVLTRTMERSVHFRLIAPPEWRIEQIKKDYNRNADEARKMMDAIDRERVYLREFYRGEKLTDYDYDVVFNTAHINVDTIVQAMLSIIRNRNIL